MLGSELMAPEAPRWRFKDQALVQDNEQMCKMPN